MVYNAQHNLLSIYGTLDSEGEQDIWSMNLRIGEGDYIVDGTGVDDAASIDGMLDDIEADLTTWWTTAYAQRAATSCKMVGFKFNGVDENGHYVNPERTFFRDFPTPLAGTSSAALPQQVTLAVTLHTNAARGLAHKGRVYLPGLASVVCDTSGRLSQNMVQPTADAFAQLLTNLGNWPGVDPIRNPGKVVVASKVGAGAMRRVNGVTVGDRFDIQRRRANKFREHRSTLAVVSS